MSYGCLKSPIFNCHCEHRRSNLFWNPLNPEIASVVPPSQWHYNYFFCNPSGKVGFLGHLMWYFTCWVKPVCVRTRTGRRSIPNNHDLLPSRKRGWGCVRAHPKMSSLQFTFYKLRFKSQIVNLRFIGWWVRLSYPILLDFLSKV